MKTPRDYTIEVRQNGRRLSKELITDPFICTSVRPHGWRVALDVLRGCYEVEVLVGGSRDVIAHVMSGAVPKGVGTAASDGERQRG